MYPPRFKRYLNYSICTSSFILIFFNEFIIYSIYRLSWSSLPCRSANCTSILFVADPQLLGETFDRTIYSPFAIYDADNYLRRTFVRAFAHTRPDVVCFLGDLLDEGSIATDESYQRYVKRFNSVFSVTKSVKTIHIPGDNDIGGENHDMVTPRKTKRFQRGFNETNFNLVKNHLRFLSMNLMSHTYPNLNDTDDHVTSGGKFFNIVLSHISVLYYPGLSMKTILDQFKPNIIFSAHSHHSQKITYPPQHIENLVDSRIVTVDLINSNGDERMRNFTEFMVPTSSYRMGVTNIGYGWAQIDGNHLYYTVLWSPNRFKSLISYLIFLILLIVVLWLNSNICQRRATYRIRERLMIATDKF